MKDRGLLCRSCHKWVPWSKLEAQYVRQQEDIVRLWVCDCGDVLREDNLTAMEGQYSDYGEQWDPAAVDPDAQSGSQHAGTDA